MTRRKIQYWVIPPQADAEFVAHMEQVLDLYQKPYDPDCPVVCMDEQPVQLVKETRPPMAATKNRPRRVDYEYERAGTAAVFLFSEPLAGWRQATARARRTKVDWALEVAGLLDGRYADCPKITLVCDHLNTHTKGAFYQVFEPARARELVRRIEFCHTPKHGSWLNIAENELSSMTRQCVRGRRIGDLGTLHDEVSAWSTDVNGTQRGVDWHPVGRKSEPQATVFGLAAHEPAEGDFRAGVPRGRRPFVCSAATGNRFTLTAGSGVSPLRRGSAGARKQLHERVHALVQRVHAGAQFRPRGVDAPIELFPRRVDALRQLPMRGIVARLVAGVDAPDAEQHGRSGQHDGNDFQVHRQPSTSRTGSVPTNDVWTHPVRDMGVLRDRERRNRSRSHYSAKP